MAQIRCSLGLGRRQVVFLADVLRQVIKLDAGILELLDELPIAFTNRARRSAPLIRVVRKAPVERPGCDRFALQKWQQIHAIERAGHAGASGRRQHAGGVVQAETHHLAIGGAGHIDDGPRHVAPPFPLAQL